MMWQANFVAGWITTTNLLATIAGGAAAVLLPTKKDQRDYEGWEFSEQDGKVSLSPSVFSTGFPCKSHYFIRANRVEWC